MMTRFQITGANAGTPKIRSALRMPVTTPNSPISTTIGNRIRVSDVTRSDETLFDPSISTGTSSGASRMKMAEIAPRITVVAHNTMPATRQASFSSPRSRSSTNTGRNAALIALSATIARIRLGRLNATAKAE